MTTHGYEERPHPNLADLYHKMGIVEGKIDAFLDRAARMDNDLTEIEERVSSLEALKWKIIGGAMAISSLFSIIISLVESHRL